MYDILQIKKMTLIFILYQYHLHQIADKKILFCTFFSMAEVDSTYPVMPEPEWAKPRDKKAPPPVYTAYYNSFDSFLLPLC